MNNIARLCVHLALFAVSLSGCSNSDIDNQWIESSSGLKYRIAKQGEGRAVEGGDEVRIHESTHYRDSTLIFSTDQIGTSLKFLVGGNQVINGVDEGVRGMKSGEIRQLIVPPKLSKRSSYPDSIHPDSILLYTIELVEIVE